MKQITVNRLILLAVLFFPALVLAFWFYHGMNAARNTAADAPKKSVQDRVQEYGTASRARLKPLFDAARTPYPPAQIVLVAIKADRVLQVFAPSLDRQLRFIHAYPIHAASGEVGPKLREGDQQVPEGIYGIESLNPNSRFHLALRLNYPNEFDREQARKEGRTDLGGDIMIHGGNASVGCLAMGDETAEDLFVLAADAGITNITVIITPVDFRRGAAVPASANIPQWMAAQYDVLKARLRELPE